MVPCSFHTLVGIYDPMLSMLLSTPILPFKTIIVGQSFRNEIFFRYKIKNKINMLRMHMNNAPNLIGCWYCLFFLLAQNFVLVQTLHEHLTLHHLLYIIFGRERRKLVSMARSWWGVSNAIETKWFGSSALLCSSLVDAIAEPPAELMKRRKNLFLTRTCKKLKRI